MRVCFSQLSKYYRFNPYARTNLMRTSLKTPDGNYNQSIWLYPMKIKYLHAINFLNKMKIDAEH